ncbi:hypothetical protein [Leptospira levettii]|uniref:Uncharacterized protein n=1 Tax=Leptospira levettii TaxID=2023178 RepID=A0AAW5V7X1_9LEPT|nr:hypothetical protein [Leptospira levettii]MCW7466984.1 hypothetical protein [Leptospira levettii]MCW7512706.1 hypothetical protein [Leptospira levettii]MCW7516428.1 hypothetical protein [Leptospira levettii]
MKKVSIVLILLIGCNLNQKRMIAPVKTKIPAIFNELAPEAQKFYILPNQFNEIKTKNGSVYFFPEDSIALPSIYQEGEYVEVEIKEYNNPIHFLSSGYSLEYIEKNSHLQLDSAGMFDIHAYYKNSELNLNKNISVKFINMNPGRSYNLYKVIDNEWQYAGSNQERISESLPYLIQYRQFNNIDKFTLWNFDLPVENSCIKISLKSLKFDEKNSIFYSVFSTSKLRINFKWSYSNSINANVPIDDTVNIIFWFENKIAIIKGIKTPKEPLGKNNYANDQNCISKGEFNLNFIPEDIFKDQAARFQYLYSN